MLSAYGQNRKKIHKKSHHHHRDSSCQQHKEKKCEKKCEKKEEKNVFYDLKVIKVETRPAYAHLIYSAPEEQVVYVFPDPDQRNVVEFNQKLESRNITHPVNGDLSKFRIEKSGVYSIRWILNTIAQITNGDFYYVGGAFVIVINEQLQPPGLQQVAAYSMPLSTPAAGVRPQIHGQDLLSLSKYDVLQLKYIKGFGTQEGLSVPPALEVHLSNNFSNISPDFNCIGASLLIQRIDNSKDCEDKIFVKKNVYHEENDSSSSDSD